MKGCIEQRNLIDAGNNSQLHDVLKMTHQDEILFLPPIRTIQYCPTDTRKIYDMHGQICKAIKNYVPKEARNSMSMHIKSDLESSLGSFELWESEVDGSRLEGNKDEGSIL